MSFVAKGQSENKRSPESFIRLADLTIQAIYEISSIVMCLESLLAHGEPTQTDLQRYNTADKLQIP
jgi:hypothetical protein